MDIDDEIKDVDGKTFFYQMRYIPENARFEDPLPDLECPRKETSHRFCPACAQLRTLEQYNTPKVNIYNIKEKIKDRKTAHMYMYVYM
jgi:DNA (cytosine-5)-methyltransferase 1